MVAMPNGEKFPGQAADPPRWAPWQPPSLAMVSCAQEGPQADRRESAEVVGQVMAVNAYPASAPKSFRDSSIMAASAVRRLDEARLSDSFGAGSPSRAIDSRGAT